MCMTYAYKTIFLGFLFFRGSVKRFYRSSTQAAQARVTRERVIINSVAGMMTFDCKQPLRIFKNAL